MGGLWLQNKKQCRPNAQSKLQLMDPNPFIQLSVLKSQCCSSKLPPGEIRSGLTLILSFSKVHHLPICQYFFSISPCFAIVTSREASPGQVAHGSVICNTSNTNCRLGLADISGLLENSQPLWSQHEDRLKTLSDLKNKSSQRQTICSDYRQNGTVTHTSTLGLLFLKRNIRLTVYDQCFNLKRSFGSPDWDQKH